MTISSQVIGWALSRTIPLCVGTLLVLFAAHQVYVTVQGDLSSVFLPGPTSIILMLLLVLGGSMLLHFALRDVYFPSIVALLVTLIAGTISFMGAYEIVGMFYPEPFVGPFTYFGFSENLEAFASSILGEKSQIVNTAGVTTIAFLVYLVGLGFVRELSFD